LTEKFKKDVKDTLDEISPIYITSRMTINCAEPLQKVTKQKMAAVGQLKIEELDEEDMASRRARRGMALNLLKPDTDAKILKVKMAQELHQALSAGEDVLRNLRKFDIIVSMRDLLFI
jgi:hypothetical protein